MSQINWVVHGPGERDGAAHGGTENLNRFESGASDIGPKAEAVAIGRMSQEMELGRFGKVAGTQGGPSSLGAGDTIDHLKQSSLTPVINVNAGGEAVQRGEIIGTADFVSMSEVNASTASAQPAAKSIEPSAGVAILSTADHVGQFVSTAAQHATQQATQQTQPVQPAQSVLPVKRRPGRPSKAARAAEAAALARASAAGARAQPTVAGAVTNETLRSANPSVALQDGVKSEDQVAPAPVVTQTFLFKRKRGRPSKASKAAEAAAIAAAAARVTSDIVAAEIAAPVVSNESAGIQGSPMPVATPTLLFKRKRGRPSKAAKAAEAVAIAEAQARHGIPISTRAAGGSATRTTSAPAPRSLPAQVASGAQGAPVITLPIKRKRGRPSKADKAAEAAALAAGGLDAPEYARRELEHARATANEAFEAARKKAHEEFEARLRKAQSAYQAACEKAESSFAKRIRSA